MSLPGIGFFLADNHSAPTIPLVYKWLYISIVLFLWKLLAVSWRFNDPYLERNLARLEKRFTQRYLASVEKDNVRRASGKSSHPTTLQSMEHNKAIAE